MVICAYMSLPSSRGSFEAFIYRNAHDFPEQVAELAYTIHRHPVSLPFASLSYLLTFTLGMTSAWPHTSYGSVLSPGFRLVKGMRARVAVRLHYTIVDQLYMAVPYF